MIKMFDQGMPVKFYSAGGSAQEIKDAGGDSLLWAGLLQLSGEDHVNAILACQSNDGRFWRSPRLKENDPINSFSRDMAIGLISAAMVSLPVASALQRWVDFTVKNKYMAANDATDNRELMTPQIYWLASHVPGVRVPWYFRATRRLLPVYLLFACMSAPRGFQLHLVACMVFILQMRYGGGYRITAKVLNRRHNNNLFFMWLAGQQDSTQISLMKSKADSGTQGLGSQWCWERSDAMEAVKDSMGHDLQFILNLYSR